MSWSDALAVMAVSAASDTVADGLCTRSTSISARSCKTCLDVDSPGENEPDSGAGTATSAFVRFLEPIREKRAAHAFLQNRPEPKTVITGLPHASHGRPGGARSESAFLTEPGSDRGLVAARPTRENFDAHVCPQKRPEPKHRCIAWPQFSQGVPRTKAAAAARWRRSVVTGRRAAFGDPRECFDLACCRGGLRSSEARGEPTPPLDVYDVRLNVSGGTLAWRRLRALWMCAGLL